MTDQTAKPNAGPRVLGTRVSELKTCPLDWLWPGRIARAKLTLIGGPAGSGKSVLATQLVAAVTTGGEWPCREGKAEQGLVVLVCPHGDPDIIVARLKAAGANLGNVHLIHEVEESDGSRPFNIATDLPVLDATIRTLDRVRAIIVDSINLPGGSSGADAARTMFEAFATLAKGHDIPVVVVGRAPGWESSGRKLASFSPAALAPVRSAFVIEIDPADETRRLLLQVKNELGPDAATLGFRIAAHPLEGSQTAARIAFEPQHDPASARHVLRAAGPRLRQRKARGDRLSPWLVRRHERADDPAHRERGARDWARQSKPRARAIPGSARRTHGHGTDGHARHVRPRLGLGEAGSRGDGAGTAGNRGEATCRADHPDGSRREPISATEEDIGLGASPGEDFVLGLTPDDARSSAGRRLRRWLLGPRAA